MSNRRKFLFTGFSLAAVWATLRFAKKKPEAKPATMKFLTQDGKLVEVDWDKLPQSKRAASKTDIQSWIKK